MKAAELRIFHPERREMLEWAGGRFDAEAFDLEAVNRKLRSRLRQG